MARISSASGRETAVSNGGRANVVRLKAWGPASAASGRFPQSMGAPQAVRPRSPVLPPEDRTPPPLGTYGPRFQVVSPRCFSCAARPALIV
jgi:hypothetical protein